MLPVIWGECGWEFFHFVTMAYPEKPTPEDKNRYYQYFHALQYVLPCKKCSNNMIMHLKKYPLTDNVLSSRNNLVRWGIDFHNVVNYNLGKPMLSYEAAMNELNKKIKSKTQQNHDYIYIFLFIVALLILAYFLYYYFIKNKGFSKKLNK